MGLKSGVYYIKLAMDRDSDYMTGMKMNAPLMLLPNQEDLKRRQQWRIEVSDDTLCIKLGKTEAPIEAFVSYQGNDDFTNKRPILSDEKKQYKFEEQGNGNYWIYIDGEGEDKFYITFASDGARPFSVGFTPYPDFPAWILNPVD